MSYGGGGFMGGGNGDNNSPGSKKQTNHTYRPVTIKQINEAFQPHPDAEFKIDGVDLDHVIFVGAVVNIAKSATNISSNIEDGTGNIDVRQWTETADDDSGKMAGIESDSLIANIRQGMYVRVVGSLKSFNNRRNINATSIKRVTDHNEIQYHLLKAVYTHLHYTRGPAQVGGAGHGAQGMQRPQQQRTGPDPYAMNGNVNTSAADDKYPELKPLGRQIMQYIDRIGHDSLPDEGVALDSIARGIQGGTYGKVKEEIENLLSEGMLYTTMDEDHVLPTTV